jgi:hypothetical protein
MYEQLEATRMQTRQRHDRNACIQTVKGIWREHDAKVYLTARERLR